MSKWVTLDNPSSACCILFRVSKQVSLPSDNPRDIVDIKKEIKKDFERSNEDLKLADLKSGDKYYNVVLERVNVPCSLKELAAIPSLLQTLAEQKL